MNYYTHLLESNEQKIADWWKRRETLVTHERRLVVFGYPFVLRTNSAVVLALADLSEKRYSACAPISDAREGEIRLFAIGDARAETLTPFALEGQIQNVAWDGHGLISLGPWGSLSVDWNAPSASGFVSPALLKYPALASRHCLDTFITVSILRQPLGMLHASGLVKDGHAVLLIGPHGIGKSTTTLHLIRAGYRLISDTSMYARQRGEQIELLGYAVGELKLTPEGLALFPELQGRASDLSMDGRRKPIFNLRDLWPEVVETNAITPRSIALCLTRRSTDGQTHLLRLDEDITLQQIIGDTCYLDEPQVMAQNLAVLHQLILRAHNFILELGSDPAEIVMTLEQMRKEYLQ